jgi:hypothetical protein
MFYSIKEAAYEQWTSGLTLKEPVPAIWNDFVFGLSSTTTTEFSGAWVARKSDVYQEGLVHLACPYSRHTASSRHL